MGMSPNFYTALIYITKFSFENKITAAKESNSIAGSSYSKLIDSGKWMLGPIPDVRSVLKETMRPPAKNN